jgi:signal transduction histidine kinase
MWMSDQKSVLKHARTDALLDVLQRGNPHANDVVSGILPTVFLTFHGLHLVQVTSILLSWEMRSLGAFRFYGLACLFLWFAIAAVQTIRTRTISIAVAWLALLTTCGFIWLVIPQMSAGLWRLDGTWLGIAAADSLICVAVLEVRRRRLALAAVLVMLNFTGAVASIVGFSLLKSPQFISTLTNMPAVVVALYGLSTVTRNAFAAQATAEAELAAARERNRLHRVIHDSALQPLEALAGGWDVDLEAVRENARQQAVLLRTAIREESGLDALVLGEQLRSLARDWDSRGLHVRCELQGEDRLVSPHRAQAIVGAANEALTNVQKHSGAGTAVIKSWVRFDQLHVSIVDEGKGFDARTTVQGIGLSLSVQKRLDEVGGRADVFSQLGNGTTVTVSVPC